MKQYKKILLAIVVFTALMPLAFFGFIYGESVASDYASRVSFNSNEWKQAEGTNDVIRIKMVDDLLSEYKLLGKSRSEIDALMGTPNRTGYFREYDYVYWLGPERGFISIDSEWLGIKFQNDVVTEMRILRD